MTGGPDDTPSTSLLFDVFALNQAVGRLLADALHDGPLTPAEYALYSAIFELEAASPTQLSRRLDIHLTTFMDQLRLIERRGHTRRIDNPRDRRSYQVTLTADGLDAHRAANLRFELVHHAFTAGLAGGEADAKKTLRELRAAVDTARFGGTTSNLNSRPVDRRSKRHVQGELDRGSPTTTSQPP